MNPLPAGTARAILFEEHASVLPNWLAAGVRDATVVCLDAHLDLQFIAPQRIERLRACRSLREFAALESLHPLSPRRDSCYGMHDFLYAAAQLGVLRRLVWVAPPPVLQGIDEALAALRQMEGVTLEQLASFRRVAGGWIEGELLGVQVTAVSWQQLPLVALEGPVVADVDLRYFVRTPNDQVWARPRVIATALRERLGDGIGLTVSRSVGTGSVPLRQRFLADHLAALWEGRDEEERHWQRLLQIETATAPEAERTAALRALLATHPGCAATCHSLAMLVPDPAERAVLLARAAALDGHYAGDVLRHLSVLRARQQDLELATVLRLQARLARWGESSERAGAAWVALGLLFAAFGQLQEAMDCDARSLRHGGGHPELALQIGRMEMAAGNQEGAMPWLERAAADDETRVAAWVHLSVCASRRGAAEEARQWAHAAHQAAPAWRETGDWLDSLSGDPRYDWGLPARSSVG